MRSRSPTGYKATDDSLKTSLTRLFEALLVVYARAKRALIEFATFGPFWGKAARLRESRRFGSRLALLADQFDGPFYVSQFSSGWRRRNISHAPLLHYVMFGWQDNRPPRPDFDPIFYRQTNPDLKADDVLWHYVTVGAARAAPRNDISRLARKRPWRVGRSAVLTIHHGRGGGSSRFLDLFEQELWQKGNNILRLRAVNGAATLAVIEDAAVADGEAAATRVFDLASDRSALAKFVHQRGVTRLLINHLVDRPPAMMEWIEELACSLNCSYDAILHDYYVLCPRVDMVTGDGRFCGIAPPEECVRCIAKDGSEVSEVFPSTWRTSFADFLARADMVFVPSEDMAGRIAPYVSRTIHVWPPEGDLELPSERRPRLASSEPLRVAVLGAVNVSKGLRVVAFVARAARLSNAPMTFTVIGSASEPDMLAREGVAVTGAYTNGQIDGLIEQAAPHVIFLPAIWPETWSFVLTEALSRGFSVVAFDIGAPAERLRRLSRGHVFPLELAERPEELLAAFLKLRDQLIER